MAHSRSSAKRIRQTHRRRIDNRAQIARIKTALKQFQAALKGNDPEAVKKALQACVSRLDKAASRHVIHRNAASRRKSALMIQAGKRLAAPAAKA